MNKTPEHISKTLLFYAKQGWPVFPCKAGDKKPLTPNGFKDASTDPVQIAKWVKKYPNANWAVATGSNSGVFVVDADLKSGGRSAWVSMCKEHSPIKTLVAQTGGGGLHYYFKYPNSGHKIKSGTGVLAPGIDIKGDGGYIIVPPSITQAPYKFSNKVEIADAPDWLLEVLDGHSPSPKPADTYTPLGQPLTVGNRNESLFHNMLNLARGGMDKESVLATARTLVKGQPDFPDTEVVAVVENAFKRVSETKGKAKEFVSRGEHGDAELFALMFHDRVIFDHAAKAWCIWYGNFWERDLTKDVNELVANDLADEYYRSAIEANKAEEKDLSTALFKRAHALRQKHRIDNVLSLASGIPGMKLEGDEWDTNPMVLGVNNGVVDLATGEFRTGAPREYIRAHSPTDWQGIDCPAPTWEKFLLGITEDPEMVDFMQRLFGYCITGLTTDHIFPVLWGEHGFNGKGTLLETLANVLGENLAMPTPAETLMVKYHSSGSGPNTALMAFQGKRLIWASESKEGHRLDSAMVKQMTGGDTITGNEKFERQKTFKATHKIMLMTNHKPHIKADDQALLDRLLTLDFQLHFCDEPKKENERKIDRDMPAKLESEASGILAWLVRGCLDWQTGGLRPTARVKDANIVYKIEEDDMGEFILEELAVSPGKTVLASEVYRVYKAWANKNGMNPMSSQAFNPKVEDKFGKRTGSGGMRAYVGIELVHPRTKMEIDLER